MELLIVGMLALFLAVVTNPRMMKNLKKRRKAEIKRTTKLVNTINARLHDDVWEPLIALDRSYVPKELYERYPHTAYRNNKYFVMLQDREHHWHLTITRDNKATLYTNFDTDLGKLRNWQDFQTIKNELCGPEHEGIEIYPKMSRLVDATNVYHVFVMKDDYEFPFTVADDEFKTTAEMLAHMKETLANGKVGLQTRK